MTTPADAGLEDLLEYLRLSRGFDFTGYKRPSLSRRITKRMDSVGVESFGTYVDYLEVHPDEFSALFDVILINVTSFFRDPQCWEAIAEKVVPAILERKSGGEPIRVWTSGCASGEEAYTLALVLCDAMGVTQFRERVKIYATDIDEKALAHARQAAYTTQQIAAVPDHLQAYFEPNVDGRILRKDLRRAVIFGRHDLVQDAPISRIDLLACRNTLMYFNAETQTGILARFRFALEDGGYLLLGKAEALLSRNEEFATVDLKKRIFSKVARRPGRDGPPGFDDLDGEGRAASARELVADAAFEAVPFAMLLVDGAGVLSVANHQARELFGVSSSDLGRAFHDLDVSFRPVELRSAIDQAFKDRSTVTLGNVVWRAVSPRTPVREATFDVLVTPLYASNGAALGTMIGFTDVSVHRQLEAELHAVNRDLEAASDELQSTNEELETTNEELQSTVEELETTNEELQATNEELETMNEELQSTNEELQTMNDELRDRTGDLNRLNTFMEAVFSSLRQAVAAIDRDMKVSVWNAYAEELWGLRRDEAEGNHLLALDFGLPLDDIKLLVRSCLDGGDPEPLTVDAVNRRGRSIRVTVGCTALVAPDGGREGVIMAMEEAVAD